MTYIITIIIDFYVKRDRVSITKATNDSQTKIELVRFFGDSETSSTIKKRLSSCVTLRVKFFELSRYLYLIQFLYIIPSE